MTATDATGVDLVGVIDSSTPELDVIDAGGGGTGVDETGAIDASRSTFTSMVSQRSEHVLDGADHLLFLLVLLLPAPIAAAGAR
ncbi:MAG: hypothetical protein WA991_08245 [Ornithinimicrobium sp.]